jgi:hypothetical protein
VSDLGRAGASSLAIDVHITLCLTQLTANPYLNAVDPLLLFANDYRPCQSASRPLDRKFNRENAL